jgi:hypothetical protein
MPLALHLFPIAESLTPSSSARSTEGLPHTRFLSSLSVGHTILLVRRSGLLSHYTYTNEEAKVYPTQSKKSDLSLLIAIAK